MRTFTVLPVVIIVLAASVIPAAARAECCLSDAELKALVEKFNPIFTQGAEIPAPPERALYRAATADNCTRLLLAYHIIWPYEQDPRPGFWPAFIRATYTGGLKLQRLIYGPGDVEVVFLTVALPEEKIIRINYETATYDAKNAVQHVPLVVEEKDVPAGLPLHFRVISWNHLFKLEPAPPVPGEPVYRFTPEPFTDELWSHYRMTKKIQTPLSLDRDHPAWEDSPDLCCPRRPEGTLR